MGLSNLPPGVTDRMIEDQIDSDDSPVDNICKRCGSWLFIVNSLCSDCTCPFSEYAQNDPRGWADFPPTANNPPTLADAYEYMRKGLNAIRARYAQEYQNSDLKSFGAITDDPAKDMDRIANETLRAFD